MKDEWSQVPWWYVWSYVAYSALVLIYMLTVAGTVTYAVFWRGESGWWYAFMVFYALMHSFYPPWRWKQLITGEKTDNKGRRLPKAEDAA